MQFDRDKMMVQIHPRGTTSGGDTDLLSDSVLFVFAFLIINGSNPLLSAVCF